MKTVSIEEARSKLSSLIKIAVSGEDVIITRAGKPVARMLRLSKTPPTKSRSFGLLRGQFEVPDDIDTKFNQEIDDLFYGSGPPKNPSENK